MLVFFIILAAAGALSAQDEEPSEPLWRRALGGAVTGSPMAQAESVVMVLDGGNLKAYSRQGNPLWNYYGHSHLAPFVSRSREGASYICKTGPELRGGGLLVAVNRAGRELWQIPLKSPLAAPVLSGWDGRLFVFTQNRIDCFTASGYRLWARELERPLALRPHLDVQGGFITALSGGEFLRVDPFGTVYARTLAAVPAAAVSFGSGGEEPFPILCIYDDGKSQVIYSSQVDEPRGKKKRTVPALPKLPGKPLAAASRGEEAAILLADGRVVLVRPGTGKILWTGESHFFKAPEKKQPEKKPSNKKQPAKKEPEKTESPPEEGEVVFDERGIFVFTRSGATGFSQDGQRLWRIMLKGAAAIPCLSDEGILYSGGEDWILHAYQVDDRVRTGQWGLYGPVPEGDYGTAPAMLPYTGDYSFWGGGELAAQFGGIEQAIRLGQVGDREREYTAFLMEAAASAVNSPRRGGAIPLHIPYRIEALRLLGGIGSRETIPFLAQLFTLDPDPLVKAAAAEAIGRVGVDPEGIALRAFSRSVFPPAPERDEQVLAAVARGTAALCRFSGPPLSGGGVKILSALAGEDKPSFVRRLAQQELDALR